MVRRDAGFLGRHEAPATLPAWLTEADVDFYAREFTRAGFRGGLNWYRKHRSQLGAAGAVDGAKVTVPALFVAATVTSCWPSAAWISCCPRSNSSSRSCDRRSSCRGCGHWTQQERPGEVNAAMLNFLEEIR